MLFEQEHYGKPISEQLSDYLKTNTTNNDIAIISEQTGVSMSTIKYVMYRTNSLTEANSGAIVEMVRKAIYNCKSKIEESMKAKTFLEDQMEKAKSYGA